MGGVQLTPPVDEKISDLARRTAEIGEKIIAANGGKVSEGEISIPVQEAASQPAELFRLADLMGYWNPDWKLERAGFGGANGGLAGIRGITYLDGDVLATYPRDEVRGVLLRRTVKLGETQILKFQAGVDAGRSWELDVYVENRLLLKRTMDGGAGKGRKWRGVSVDLDEFSGKSVTLRLYQRVLVPEKVPGNAYWKCIDIGLRTRKRFTKAGLVDHPESGCPSRSRRR